LAWSARDIDEILDSHCCAELLPVTHDNSEGCHDRTAHHDYAVSAE
jgi:hypothetical protein